MLDHVRGYSLETWINGAWVHTDAGKGNSYTYDQSAGKVRLTWNSRPNAFVLIVR